jgi:integrase
MHPRCRFGDTGDGGNAPHHSSFTSQTWKKARERVGRPDLDWHHLHHTYVAIRIAAGAHLKEIQEECGHSSITTTMNIYGHLFESLSERTADAMAEMYRAAEAAAPASKVRAIR